MWAEKGIEDERILSETEGAAKVRLSATSTSCTDLLTVLRRLAALPLPAHPAPQDNISQMCSTSSHVGSARVVTARSGASVGLWTACRKS